jgi:hypothetical protein
VARPPRAIMLACAIWRGTGTGCGSRSKSPNWQTTRSPSFTHSHQGGLQHAADGGLQVRGTGDGAKAGRAVVGEVGNDDAQQRPPARR